MDAPDARHTQHVTTTALVLVCGFLLGIVYETFIPLSFMTLFLLGGAVCLGFVWWRLLWRFRPFFLLLLLLLGGVCGALRLAIDTSSDVHPRLEAARAAEVTITGVVDREVVDRAETARLIVRAEVFNDTPIDHIVMVTTERFPEFTYGDRVWVRGTLKLPEAFRTEFGRTFDYPGYLSARDVRYTIPFAEVERVGTDGGNPIIAGLLFCKRVFMERVEALLPEPSAGIAEGITLGVKRALGDTLESAFRTTGIIHIVVLSGYNVTIVAEGIMRLLRSFTLPRTRMILGIAAITAFAIVAGLSPTVVRASLMAGLILYARATGNAYTTMRALVCAGVVMLCINPRLLMHDPGFQLSFVATAGLIVMAPIIEARLSRVPTTLNVREFVTATLATQLFILPLLLYLIGEFSVVAVLVNVLVLPVIPLAMFTTFLTGTIGVISTHLALLPAYATHLLLSYVVAVVMWFAHLPFSSFIVPAFPFWLAAAGYAGIALFLYRRSRRNPISHPQ